MRTGATRSLAFVRLFAVSCCAAAVGCAQIGVTRIGERFPPNPDDCAIDYRYGSFQEVMSLMQKDGYVQVASAAIANAGVDYNERLKSLLQPQACKVGGEIVYMTSSNERGELPGSGMASFAILRRKTGALKVLGAPGEGDPSASYSCTAAVEVLGKEYVGEASDRIWGAQRAKKSNDPGALSRQAKQKACAAVRADHAVDCSDGAQVVESSQTSFEIVNGEQTVTARVTLRPVLAVVQGESESAESSGAACRAALADACKKAPAGGECEAKDVGCQEVEAGDMRCSPARRFRLPR
jgi:hypothetical protein